MSIRLPGDTGELCGTGVPGSDPLAGLVVVNFKKTTPADRIEKIIADYASRPTVKHAGQNHLEIEGQKFKASINLKNPAGVADLIKELKALPEVESAERVIAYHEGE